MRAVSSQTHDTWVSGDFTGDRRGMVRATIQRMSVALRTYGFQTYACMQFGQHSQPLELPNLKEVKWNRTTENLATMTMVLYNTDPLPLGATPIAGEFDVAGAYTPKRGGTAFSSRWGHTPTGWQDWIVPDRIIRTFEGYGFNPTVAPEKDTNLYLSGTWLIDDVDISHDGLITVTCRDMGRALTDQIIMPPIVPMQNYPLYFDAFVTKQTPPVVTISGSEAWFPPCWDSDVNLSTSQVGNVYYAGAQLSPVSASYFDGHSGFDAVDGSTTTYWYSKGLEAPSEPWSYEWITIKFKPRTLGALQIRPWGGPYRVYISVLSTDGVWHGDRNVPYDPSGHPDNGSSIPYVESIDIGADEMITHQMLTIIENAWKVRLTFHDLTPAADGRYHCGLRYIRTSEHVVITTPGTTYVEPATSPPGYGDFTDIVRHLLAWGGFFWPKESDAATNVLSDGTSVTTPAPSDDGVLASGRVWGDLQQTGTHGIAPMGITFFDKKPLLDVVNALRDMVGFVFFIDEGGGAVFRPPNIWSVGNWVGNGSVSAGRTGSVIEIDETQTLMSLGARLSSRSIRERTFVGNVTGQVGAVSRGQNPYPSGLRRVGGWTDQHFTTEQECQIMADLVTLRQLFTYRTDKVRIPGFPAIQVDDQVRLYERTTEEGYLHYVTDISMAWSAETGVYTYDLGTHWLGETPFSNWTFDPAGLAQETQQYLRALGVYR